LQVSLFSYVLTDSSPVHMLREVMSKCRDVVCENMMLRSVNACSH